MKFIIRFHAAPVAVLKPSPARLFIHTDDGHRKFWEIKPDGGRCIVRYGRIGTKGQRQDVGVAHTKAMAQLIASKLAKGYTEVIK